MLHEGASTQLILTRLTRAIQLRFSIRQGDALAMLLYIIYVEPLLLTLEKKINGLRVENIAQKIEAFCDDVNVTTEKQDQGRKCSAWESLEFTLTRLNIV